MSTQIEAEVIPQNAVALRTEQPAQVPALWGTTDQREIIRKASDTASALRDVMRKQGLMSNIKGKEYPRCEAWTLAGTMLGVFPVLVWTKRLEDGWEARVEARTLSGAIVGAAEAECLRGERNWSDRDDFALRSMAQTRATAKALRMPLGFVMTLAGFEATPSEEMTAEMERAPEPPKPTPPAPKPKACATDESRAKMIQQLKAGPGEPNRDQTTEYFVAIGHLIPTEELEELPLRYVPATVAQMNALSAKIVAFDSGLQAEVAFPANDEPEAPKMRRVATPKASESDLGVKDTRRKVVGVIQAISVKEGVGKKGPWTRYGIKIGEDWFGSFSDSVGTFAQDNKNQEVTLFYQVGEKGNDAIEIVDGDGNSSAEGEE